MKGKKMYQFWMPEEDYAELKQFCSDADIPMSNVCRIGIKQYMARYKDTFADLIDEPDPEEELDITTEGDD